MGTKNTPAAFDCYDNAEPDEPMFVLLARDSAAAELVRAWARMRSTAIDMGRRSEEDRAQVKEAYRCADAMDAWRKENRK